MVFFAARIRPSRSGRCALVASALAVLLLAACGQPVVDGPDVSVVIDSPADGATVVSSMLTVSGRFVADGPVAINAQNATTGTSTSCTVAGDTFACNDIVLTGGGNTVVVTATDGQGRTDQDAVNITYEPGGGDAALTIHSPASAGMTASSTIDVTGSTSGFGSGLVVSIETGTVQGTCATADGAFACQDVPLLEGDNLLVVTGRDDGGREASDAVFVEYESGFSDGGAPTVTITTPADGSTFERSWVRIQADVHDDGLIARVEARVDGVPVSCDYDGEVADCLVFLLETSQSIEVRAEDEGGRVGSDEMTLFRDDASPAFDIDLSFFGPTYTDTQLAAFDAAVAVWEDLIVGDLEPVSVDFVDGEDPQPDENYACGQGEPAFSGSIDDLRVYVTSFESDSNVLGFASPCLSRLDGEDPGTNFVGIMSFNTTYLEELEADGQLVDTIVHELGHVLGFGTNWEYGPYFDLLQYEPSTGVCSDVATFDVPPVYVGEFARLAYERLGGTGDVPVEADYGEGTKCGHWDEDRFGNELMTGILDVGTNPLSELSLASFIDLGLDVDLSGAEAYTPPSGLSLQREGGLDLAGREILMRPRGGVSVHDGRLHLFEPDADPRQEFLEQLRDHEAP